MSPREVRKSDGSRVVEIGAKRQSCDARTMLVFKLVLEAVLGALGE